MFGTLINWLWKALDAAEWNWNEIWKQIKSFFVSTWGLLLIVSGLVWSALQFAIHSVDSLIAAVEHIIWPSISVGSSGLSQTFAICNTFLPLEELFGYIVIYGTVVAALTAYRAIKSWIPTLS